MSVRGGKADSQSTLRPSSTANKRRRSPSPPRRMQRESSIPGLAAIAFSSFRTFQGRLKTKRGRGQRRPTSYLSARLRLADLPRPTPAGVPTQTASARRPRRGRFTCATLAIRKSRQGFPRRLVPLRFTERCAASSGARTRCLFLFGRTASIRRRVRCQCVGPTDPRSS